MSRTKKSIKKGSQKLEARLSARSFNSGLEYLVQEMGEEIGELKQIMEELIRLASPSL